MGETSSLTLRESLVVEIDTRAVRMPWLLMEPQKLLKEECSPRVPHAWERKGGDRVPGVLAVPGWTGRAG